MPTNAEFLSPVLALVAWTLVMWVWMYATRIPAMNAAGIDPQEAAYPGTWAHRLKSGVRSVADNYNHLHEQPTIFGDRIIERLQQHSGVQFEVLDR